MSSTPPPADGRESDAIIGKTLNERYQVERFLGAGAMGAVYEGFDLKGNCRVALKSLPGNLRDDPEFAHRIHWEVRFGFAVQHQNVVRLLNMFVTQDWIFLVMEYVDGRNLDDYLQKNHPLEIGVALSFGSQLASAVQAIHTVGAIHRDIKPENILIERGGVVRVVDLGIALLLEGNYIKRELDHKSMRDEEDLRNTCLRITGHNGFVGTPFYASPEYFRDGSCDERSDIYAIGMVIYQLVSGEYPFHAKNFDELAEIKQKPDTPSLLTFRPDCPPELDALCEKALDPDPEVRQQTAKDLLQEIEQIRVPQNDVLSSRTGSLRASKQKATIWMDLYDACRIVVRVVLKPFMPVFNTLMPQGQRMFVTVLCLLTLFAILVLITVLPRLLEEFEPAVKRPDIVEQQPVKKGPSRVFGPTSSKSKVISSFGETDSEAKP